MCVQPLADRNFAKGFNRIYDRKLAKNLAAIFRQHQPLFEAAAKKGVPFDTQRAVKANTIRGAVFAMLVLEWMAAHHSVDDHIVFPVSRL